MPTLASRVVGVVLSRLTAINGVAPYETNVGTRIFHARRSLDIADLPCVVVWEGEETSGALNAAGGSANGSTDSFRTTLTINVEGLVPADQATTGSLIGKIKGDIKRALLLASDPRMTDADGVIAQGGLEYVGTTPLQREDGALFEGVQCAFRINLVEGYGNPNAPR